MNQPSEIELHATITRADGKVEPQGMVAYWSKNPLKRIAYRLRGGKGKVTPHAHRCSPPR